MEKRKTDNNTLRVQEMQETAILSNWAKANQKEAKSKKYSVRSNDMGGHMELKEGESGNLIGPSEERVQELLEDCGLKLGIHYVGR